MPSLHIHAPHASARNAHARSSVRHRPTFYEATVNLPGKALKLAGILLDCIGVVGLCTYIRTYIHTCIRFVGLYFDHDNDSNHIHDLQIISE